MLMLSPTADLLDLQDGVIARRQVLDVPGESDAAIRRRLRRRDWVTVLPGIYLNHTGPPTWRQRAWAAVLYAHPAALANVSAIRAADGPGKRVAPDDRPIHVAIDHRRTVEDQPGLVIHRSVHFAATVQGNLSPPRVRIEHAVIDAAADASSELAAIAILSDAVRSRRTTAARLLQEARARRRLRSRELILGVLSDAATGTTSVLEVEYLRRVERAHRLPTARRQVRDATSGVVYRDAEHEEFDLIIELDGRIGHSTTSERDADFERDLDAAVTDRDTLRLGWGQARVRPCQTATKLALVFQRRGWRGEVQPCPDCPTEAVEKSSPGDQKSTA